MFNNEMVPMTRRYPNLPKKVLMRDSKISLKLIKAWDLQQDQNKVLDIFLKEKKNLSPERYWETLRTVWILCGSIERSPLFSQMMKSGLRSKYYFSTPEEQQQLRELPDVFSVYRVCNEEFDGGLSWTLSKEYAEWYKEAYDKKMTLSKKVTKQEVFALINRNKEHEIIILP